MDGFHQEGLQYLFNRVKDGSATYQELFYRIYHLVLNGYSSFKTMDSVYAESNRKEYYLKNPVELTGYDYTNKIQKIYGDFNENKVLHTANK